MKNKSLLLIYFSIFLNANCLTQQEVSKMNNLDDFYKHIPNMLKCTQAKNYLSKVVCTTPEYLLMFDYLSKANIYAYENTTKQEVDYQKINQQSKLYWLNKFNTSAIDTNKLCYDLKKTTTELLGGLSPYQNNSFINKSLSRYQVHDFNQYGLVLEYGKTKLYIGNSCDIYSKQEGKGTWKFINYTMGTFLITFDSNKTIEFIDTPSHWQHNIQNNGLQCQ